MKTPLARSTSRNVWPPAHGDRKTLPCGLLPAPGGDVGDPVDRDAGERAVRHRDQEQAPSLVEVLVDRVLDQMPGEQRQIGRLIGLLGIDEQELPDLAAAARGEQRGAVDVTRRHLTIARRADPALLLDLDVGRRQRRRR